jgi:ribokinase
VSVVDTTGAGDTFVGVLAASLALGRPWEEGMARAVAAASLCVTRPGAQASIPTAAEVDALLR